MFDFLSTERWAGVVQGYHSTPFATLSRGGVDPHVADDLGLVIQLGYYPTDVRGGTVADATDPTLASNPDLMEGLQVLANSLPDYHRAEMYYEATNPEFFASIRLRRALERTGVTFRFNMAKTPVDVMADRLEINAIEVKDDDEADQILQQIWEYNMMELESTNIHRRAGEFGDAYLMVWPTTVDDEEDTSGIAQGEAVAEDTLDYQSVDMFYNSAKTTRLVYDAENPLKKKFAIKKWTLPSQLGMKAKPPTRVNIYYPDRIEKYITTPNSKGNNRRDWIEFHEPEEPEWPTPNPFGEIPVFHFRTGTPYGDPEHRAGYGPQDAINKLIITHAATIDYYGFPQRYLLADSTHGSDELADFDTSDDINRFEDTGHDSTLRAGPGEVWWLNGVRQAGQFNPPDPAVFLAPLEVYIRMMAQVTSTPLHYFDPQTYSRLPPSGESIRAAEVPLLKKVRRRQITYGNGWTQAMQFALKIATWDDDSETGRITDSNITIRWTPGATIDDLTGWQMMALKQAQGVPPRQTLLEAGYEEEQVDAWLPYAGDDLNQRVELLTKVATAAQALGTAANLGALDPATVQTIIMGMLNLPEEKSTQFDEGTS